MKKLLLSSIAMVLVCVGLSSAQTDPDSRALHHFYENKGNFYHFYTADQDEAASLKKNKGWKYVGITGYILAKKTDDTVPLFRLVKAQFGGTNHFYTTNMQEANAAAVNHGWTAEGIAGYVAIKKIAGTTPLYRLYLPCTGTVSEDLSTKGPCTGGDVHYYTTSTTEKAAAMKNGMALQKTAAYIWAEPVQKKLGGFPDSGLAAQKAAADRKAMIDLGYSVVFGRQPTANDFKYWDAKAKAEETTYIQLFNELRGFLNGDTVPGNGELNATIKRAYAENGKPAPGLTEMVMWMKTSRQKKLWFVPLKAEIAKQPVANQPGGFPESQAQVNERKAMIYKGYAVAFGREPTKNDFTYWDAKAKAENTTYAQHFNELREWLTGGSSGGDAELSAVIKRAFAANGKPAPSFMQHAFWMKESKAKKHWYEVLKVEIKQKSN